MADNTERARLALIAVKDGDWSDAEQLRDRIEELAQDVLALAAELEAAEKCG